MIWAGVNDQMDAQSDIATAAAQLYAKLKADRTGDPGVRRRSVVAERFAGQQPEEHR